MRIILVNQFHNCSSELNVPRLPYQLSEGQRRKVYRQNCGASDCRCGALWEDPQNGRVHRVEATGQRLAVDMDCVEGKDVLIVREREGHGAAPLAAFE